MKTGTDPGAGAVSLANVVPTTVADLGAITAPPQSALGQDNRNAPTETTVFQVHATLSGYKLEGDSDIHLILTDGSATMIAEIPDPACVSGYPDQSASPFLAGIEQARTAFGNRYTATGSFQSANVPVTVTGVGFFDFPHGQSGIAPNAIELHPVLAITFGNSLSAALHPCYPTTLAGKCYVPGQHCQDDFSKMTGTAAGGVVITCRRGTWVKVR